MPVTKYELVVVLDPSLTEADHHVELEKIEAVITENGGAVESKDIWGKRRLAYQINKKREGVYALFHFDADSASKVLPELERYLRITETILRHLVTKAVIGKSKGEPARAEEHFRSMSRGPRPGGPGGPRGPRSDYRGGDSRGADSRGGDDSSAGSPAPASPDAPGEEPKAEAPAPAAPAPATSND